MDLPPEPARRPGTLWIGPDGPPVEHHEQIVGAGEVAIQMVVADVEPGRAERRAGRRRSPPTAQRPRPCGTAGPAVCRNTPSRDDGARPATMHRQVGEPGRAPRRTRSPANPGQTAGSVGPPVEHGDRGHHRPRPRSPWPRRRCTTKAVMCGTVGISPVAAAATIGARRARGAGAGARGPRPATIVTMTNPTFISRIRRMPSVGRSIHSATFIGTAATDVEQRRVVGHPDRVLVVRRAAAARRPWAAAMWMVGSRPWVTAHDVGHVAGLVAAAGAAARSAR